MLTALPCATLVTQPNGAAERAVPDPESQARGHVRFLPYVYICQYTYMYENEYMFESEYMYIYIYVCIFL